MKQQGVLGIVKKLLEYRIHEGKWKEVEWAEISSYWIIVGLWIH